jgi:hypothetical protein
MKPIETEQLLKLLSYAELQNEYDIYLTQSSDTLVKADYQERLRQIKSDIQDLLEIEEGKLFFQFLQSTIKRNQKPDTPNKEFEDEELQKNNQNLKKEISKIRIYLANQQKKIDSANQELIEIRSTFESTAPTPKRQQQIFFVASFTAFAVALLLLVYTIYMGLSNTSNISVEINIGELIGGTLFGIGAALAGGAYAFKTIGDNNNQDK